MDLEKRLVAAVKGQNVEANESFMKAMEITKAYASSGTVSQYSSVSRLFYELFEMFETGQDPRLKK